MKVLYISGMYPNPTYPQKGIFCHEQVKALKELGVEVDVLVPMTIYDKEYTTKIWEYEGVTIRYIRYIKYPGVRFFEHIGKALYLSLVCSGINFKQYDILHADAPLPAGDAVMRLSRKYNIPYVVHGHGLDVFMDVDYAGRPNCCAIENACQKVYKGASRIIGVSNKVIRQLSERLALLDKCCTVYNGVDIEKFFPKGEKVPNEILQMVSVGNLIEIKGHQITIKAMREMVQMGYTKVHLDIYGKGQMEQELKRLVDELNLQQYISFHGYIPYTTLADKLRQYDLFVLPSYYEAIGCVYLEAMASGLVTIGCRDNGIEEVIENNYSGFLVRPQDVESLKEVLEYAYLNRESEEIQHIAETGRKIVLEHFTWRHSACELKQVYTNLINGETS